jgi:LAO/AO transport system kinase
LMPQLGDEIQAFKAGFNEIGDIFVVNKADIVNPAKTMFNVASGVEEKNGWRPPVLKTVALKGTGVASFVDTIEKFEKFLDDHGLRDERTRKRLEAELVEAAFSDFYTETLSRLKRERQWHQLLGQVSKKELDPETAAGKLVKIIGKLDASPNA